MKQYNKAIERGVKFTVNLDRYIAEINALCDLSDISRFKYMTPLARIVGEALHHGQIVHARRVAAIYSNRFLDTDGRAYELGGLLDDAEGLYLCAAFATAMLTSWFSQKTKEHPSPKLLQMMLTAIRAHGSPQNKESMYLCVIAYIGRGGSIELRRECEACFF